MSSEHGKQLLDILNRIAKDQLDPRAAMQKSDEIKVLAGRGATSPETIANGLEIYSKAYQSSPKLLVRRLSHDSLAR
jgi:hypothetical protein